MDKYRGMPLKGDTKKDLWMRYFTEMTEETRKPAPELLADPDIAKAINLLEIINYNEAEEYLYDKYWDAVSIEATWKGIGHREGEKEGLEEGLQQGREEGRQEERRNLVRNLSAKGLDIAKIALLTGMDESEIGELL